MILRVANWSIQRRNKNLEFPNSLKNFIKNHLQWFLNFKTSFNLLIKNERIMTDLFKINLSWNDSVLISNLLKCEMTVTLKWPVLSNTFLWKTELKKLLLKNFLKQIYQRCKKVFQSGTFQLLLKRDIRLRDLRIDKYSNFHQQWLLPL